MAHAFHATLCFFISFFALRIHHCNSGCGAEDSTLAIQRKCGQAYRIEMTYDSMQRSVWMYIPSIVCDGDGDDIDKKHSFPTNITTLPMLLSFHCYGGGAQSELDKWQSYAEQFTFILIVPEGFEHSWNADNCCGEALQNRLDDVGFIQTVINGAQTSFPAVFPLYSVADDNRDGYVWITGFSNGAFLADKIAWLSAVNQFSRVVAAAPMAGYIYDHWQYVASSVKQGDKTHQVSMYFHHSLNDSYVNIAGCCAQHLHACCCGIGSQTTQCVSIYDEFRNWLSWNGCNAELSFEVLEQDTQLAVDVDVGGGGSEGGSALCAYATPQQHGCDAATSLCLYEGVHHTQWAMARRVPQLFDVVVFFMRALCGKQNGGFDEQTYTCECNANGAFEGMFCLTPTSTSKNVMGSQAHAQSNKEKVKIEDEKKNDMIMTQMHEEDMKGEDEDGKDNSTAQGKWMDVVRNGKQRQMKQQRDHEKASAGASGGAAHAFKGVVAAPLEMPNLSTIVVGSMVFIFFGVAAVICRRRKQRGYKYSQVHTDDHEQYLD